MKRFLLAFLFLLFSCNSKQSDVNQNNSGQNLVPSQRKLIVKLHFVPPNTLVLEPLQNDMKTRALLTAPKLIAIGDEAERGRSVPVPIEFVKRGWYEANLGLPSGVWNLHLQAIYNNAAVNGQYLLGIGKTESRGVIGLVPNNPESTRLTKIFVLMLAVPIALGIVLVLFASLMKNKKV